VRSDFALSFFECSIVRLSAVRPEGGRWWLLRERKVSLISPDLTLMLHSTMKGRGWSPQYQNTAWPTPPIGRLLA
jgi:hypothetical protein